LKDFKGVLVYLDSLDGSPYCVIYLGYIWVDFIFWSLPNKEKWNRQRICIGTRARSEVETCYLGVTVEKITSAQLCFVHNGVPVVTRKNGHAKPVDGE